jgi:hypothetical protein
MKIEEPIHERAIKKPNQWLLWLSTALLAACSEQGV